MPRKKQSASSPTVQPEWPMHRIRDQSVMVDSDLAALYRVPTKTVLQAVKRNKERFPEDFAFQLTLKEFRDLISLSTTSHDGQRKKPWVFTDCGVAMLASVLDSPTAVQIGIENIRAFFNLPGVLEVLGEVVSKMSWPVRERQQSEEQFKDIIQVLRKLRRPHPSLFRRRGFEVPNTQEPREPQE